ncbi:hypothetical protein BJX68DRAFT_247919 [Aspergillus pseudodeflectus]|uniref:Uncharacterized protein n=1 Tax=Aspergillus pseudodeflectus TaxID=176178 RepID=A0ABR4JH13_9EURO
MRSSRNVMASSNSVGGAFTIAWRSNPLSVSFPVAYGTTLVPSTTSPSRISCLAEGAAPAMPTRSTKRTRGKVLRMSSAIRVACSWPYVAAGGRLIAMLCVPTRPRT